MAKTTTNMQNPTRHAGNSIKKVAKKKGKVYWAIENKGELWSMVWGDDGSAMVYYEKKKLCKKYCNPESDERPVKVRVEVVEEGRMAKSKSTLAWGLKDKEGKLHGETWTQKNYAYEGCLIGWKVVRVKITEVKGGNKRI